MRLRTQLVVASLLLAILPLAAIVTYSYESSRKALESAYRQEAARMTRQMNSRVAMIRNDLDMHLAAVTALPLENLPKDATVATHPVVDEIMMAMGDAAPLIDSLEFQPEHLAPRAERAHPTPATTLNGRNHAKILTTPRMAELGGPVTTEAPEPPEPIVIDLPNVPMPPFVVPPAFHDRVEQISRISRQLGQAGSTMSAEERAKLTAEFEQAHVDLEREMKVAREQHDAEIRQAVQKQREQRMAAAAEREASRRDRQRMKQEQKLAESTPRAGGAAADVPAATPAPNTAPVARASAAVASAAAASAVAAAREAYVIKRNLSDAEKQRLRERARQVSMILGRELNMPVETGGKVVGRVSAQISPDVLVRRVLGPPSEDDSELAFAVDGEGHVWARSDREKATVERLGIAKAVAAGQPLHDFENWVVATSNVGGLRVGVARRVGDNLIELRRTAARNFGYGLALVAFALIGIVPLANHMSRDVMLVTAGAERIAQGDLQTRVPVRSKNEFGQLAAAFNRMARDLSENQQRIFEQERARREQEMQQRLLAVEYDRKAAELEEARRFQLSLLPKSVPDLARFDVAVFTQTATEVGGDYYDFHVSPDQQLTVTIGDATGHGAKAGTMVTVIKTLFSGYVADTGPAAFLSAAADKIKRMDLGRMAMALAVARFSETDVTIASAGMPPALVHRSSTGTLDEIALGATPLGTIGVDYNETVVPLAPGDTVLFMSDGFPELTNALGHQLGYPAAAEAFAQAVAPQAQDVVEKLVSAVREWHGDQPLNDDITFVVVRVEADGTRSTARSTSA